MARQRELLSLRPCHLRFVPVSTPRSGPARVASQNGRSIPTGNPLCGLHAISFWADHYNTKKTQSRNFWRWFATIDGLELSGDATKQVEAISDAQQAIDRVIELVGPR